MAVARGSAFLLLTMTRAEPEIDGYTSPHRERYRSFFMGTMCGNPCELCNAFEYILPYVATLSQ